MGTTEIDLLVRDILISVVTLKREFHCVYYDGGIYMVACGAVYDGFEHWKELVKLLCMSETALSDNVDLFTNFISKSPTSLTRSTTKPPPPPPPPDTRCATFPAEGDTRRFLCRHCI